MVPKFIPKISDQRSFLNLLGFREWLIYSLMNLSDSFAQSGFWVSICQVSWSCTRRFSGEVICALQPCYSDVFNATQMFLTHFRRWVAETIRLTYENSSESNLPRIKAHDVRGISASIAYYRNTPLKELCGLFGWKSSNVLVRHYLRDIAADTELQDIPLVAARTAFR